MKKAIKNIIANEPIAITTFPYDSNSLALFHPSITQNRPMAKVNIPILANTLVNRFPTQSSFFAKVECAMRDDIITIAIRLT